MRLPLAKLEVFAAIARHGSLRAAAAALGVRPSTVSHQLRTLEERIGTALFIRTTRSVSLTEAGRALMRGTGPAFDQLSEALESARTTGHAARGTLKLAMPEFVLQLLVGPVLNGFCENYPEIEIEFALTDALSDILGEELHAGFRLGDRIAQDMVAVRLTPPLSLVIAARPDYLRSHVIPFTPWDLLDHNCIRYRFQSSGRIARWEFRGSEGSYSVDVRGKLIANTLPASVRFSVQGLGLVYTFRDFCREELSDGRLVPVLEEHLPEVPGVHIYFPREYRSMVPLRIMIEYLKRQRIELNLSNRVLQS